MRFEGVFRIPFLWTKPSSFNTCIPRILQLSVSEEMSRTPYTNVQYMWKCKLPLWCVFLIFVLR
jgi:hypothetical protein